MNWSIESWQDLLQRLNLSADEIFFHELDGRYRSPNRYYHNTTHIENCLSLLNEFAHLADRKLLVEAAIWLHDAIYQSFSSKNELKSAELAAKMFGELGMNEEDAQVIYDLILITAHREKPEGNDARLLVDIDLSILGADAAAYDVYERAIRKEYRFVPKRFYQPGRKKLLTSFIERPQLYCIPELRDRFEKQARENLKRAIERL
ncbi:MAG: HD domain-containing protein [Calditrichia bacterium]